MNLEGYKLVLVVVGLIGVLLIASPNLANIISPPSEEHFSELYLLDPNDSTSNYPSTIYGGITYLVYLGIGNNMGSSGYYTCFVKVGNENDLLPNTKLGTPSSFPAVYEFKSFVRDGGKWEEPLTFRVNKITSNDGVSQLTSITVNGVDSSVNQKSEWNSNKTGYYYYLFVELWNFNSTSGVSQYHNRFVSLALNITV